MFKIWYKFIKNFSSIYNFYLSLIFNSLKSNIIELPHFPPISRTLHYQSRDLSMPFTAGTFIFLYLYYELYTRELFQATIYKRWARKRFFKSMLIYLNTNLTFHRQCLFRNNFSPFNYLSRRKKTFSRRILLPFEISY